MPLHRPFLQRASGLHITRVYCGKPNPRKDNSPADSRNLQRCSQREYGNRVGVWRTVEVLARYEVRATVALNSMTCETQPQIMEAAMNLDGEFMRRDQTNTKRTTGVPDDHAEIKATLDGIEKFTGKRPVGWLGPGREDTLNSLDSLIDEGVWKATGAEIVQHDLATDPSVSRGQRLRMSVHGESMSTVHEQPEWPPMARQPRCGLRRSRQACWQARCSGGPSPRSAPHPRC